MRPYLRATSKTCLSLDRSVAGNFVTLEINSRGV